ncbi:MAG: hypothetical protein SX243_11715 [Acidobacteriota bacterium]|nr:hypothetical protein [Acidobacteriota bacterium]
MGLQRELPAGLGDPLHLDEPWLWTWVLWALALLVIDLWWWRGIVSGLRRLDRAASAPAPVPAAVESPGPDWVQRLHRTHAEAGTYRRGFHALSELVRQDLDAAHGGGGLWARFTARELEEHSQATRHPAALRFLRMLERHQFRRRDPTESDWGRMCRLAREVLGLAADSESGDLS